MERGFSVLIAGGGVAAVEAALTLRDVGERRARIELLAPEPLLWYRPVSVAEPFGLGAVRRFDLGVVAEHVGGVLTSGALASVNLDRRLARTSAGATIPYDALLVASGARPTEAVRGALTFRGPADTGRLRRLLEELATDVARRVAFAVPRGAAWPLPAYELALMTARHLQRAGTPRVDVTLVTPEPAPLRLFGPSASDAARALLDEAGVEFVGDARPLELRDGRLLLADGDLVADRVVALPRLVGTAVYGLPQTADGFMPVDDHCLVLGTDDVFAAGDVTSFPVKQGGIAAQQADVAGEAIAVLAGATLVPRPFRPVLRGLLLTGAGAAYLRRDLADGDASEWSDDVPMWWPPTKIVGERVTPFLAALAGEDEAAGPPPGDYVDVSVPLGDEEILGLGHDPGAHRLSEHDAELPVGLGF